MQVSLYTKNCIVTGLPASVWSGHVIALSKLAEDENGETGKDTRLHIIAGFKDSLTLQNFKFGINGYAGAYQSFMELEDHKHPV